MKCFTCGGSGERWDLPFAINGRKPAQVVCFYCSGRGFIPGNDPMFWTPAERAGLKAMGQWVMLARVMHSRVKRRGRNSSWLMLCNFIEAVCAYVRAAREVKEGKE